MCFYFADDEKRLEEQKQRIADGPLLFYKNINFSQLDPMDKISENRWSIIQF